MAALKDPERYKELMEELERRFVRNLRPEVMGIAYYLQKHFDDAFRANDNKDVACGIDRVVIDLAEGLRDISGKGFIKTEDDFRWLYENYGLMIDSRLESTYDFARITSHLEKGSKKGEEFGIVTLSADEPFFSRMVDMYETMIRVGQSAHPDWFDVKFKRRYNTDHTQNIRLTSVYALFRLDAGKEISMPMDKKNSGSPRDDYSLII